MKRKYPTEVFDLTDNITSSTTKSKHVIDLCNNSIDDSNSSKKPYSINNLDAEIMILNDPYLPFISSHSSGNSNLTSVSFPSSSSSSSSSSSQIYPSNLNSGKKNPLYEIINIFPDADEKYITNLIESYGSSSQSINTIIQQMADKGYSKRQIVQQTVNNKIDFSSTSWETTPLYRENALIQLQNDFPYIKIESIRSLLISKNYHYTPSLQAIEAALNRKANLSDLNTRYIDGKVRVSKPLSAIEYESILPGLKKLNLAYKKTLSRFVNVSPKCPIFTEEYDIIELKRLKEFEEHDRKYASQLNEEIAEAEGTFF